MTSEKFLEVIGKYRRLFEEKGVEKIEYPHDEILENIDHGMGHCYGMLDQMEKFVDQIGREEKVCRWLGFIQGFLWAHKDFTIEELKNHNRPTELV